MEKERPYTTLFLLSSVDGKISTGSVDERDFDTDIPRIDGVKEGLHQYYELEQNTDIWSFNSGRTLKKIGVNKYSYNGPKLPVKYAIWDKASLTPEGIDHLCRKAEEVVVFSKYNNSVLRRCEKYYPNFTYCQVWEFDLTDVLYLLYKNFDCNRLTVQTGGLLNSMFLRDNLIDEIHLVMAPFIIGGKNTPTVADGYSLNTVTDLNRISKLSLISMDKLCNDYISLRYKVLTSKEDT